MQWWWVGLLLLLSTAIGEHFLACIRTGYVMAQLAATRIAQFGLYEVNQARRD